MIHTVTRREFLVACDGCGQVGVPAATSDRAGELARALGWRPVPAVCGLEFLTTWFCPRCQRQRELAGVAPPTRAAA
jgi:hypothetical protein